jgi:peptidoglycan/LPS O-acetylase OafA/YrhL
MQRRNGNIDLLRLVAAGQVAFVHYTEHMPNCGPAADLLARLLWAVPGVPIFFLLSGYLIFQSVDRTPSLAGYARKRVLRLYPGLWAGIAVSLVLVTATGYPIRADGEAFAIWVLAQATIGQSYNPTFLRGFGSGVLNGSLWTIGVEVQFYILAPILLRLTRLVASKGRGWLLVPIIPLALANELFGTLKTGSSLPLIKALSITVLPFLFYFLIGGSAYVLGLARFRCSARAVIATAITLAVCAVITCLWGGRYGGNYISVPLGGLLAALVLMLISGPPLPGGVVLKGRDYSYSLYLYHMPVINAALQLGLPPLVRAVAVTIATTIFAVLSWHLVERPALRLAHRRAVATLRP